MQPKIIISGGGTGGHIFPAVAVAHEIKNRFPECNILFIGALGRMEMEKVPLEGFEIIGLPISGLKRSLSLANFKVALQFIGSYFKAKKIIKNFKPDVALGTGGYASLAVLKAAIKLNIPTVIWEGNGYAGLTNRLLAKKVNIICTGLPNMEAFFPADKTVITGNPVRKEILNIADRLKAFDFFKLDGGKKTVFITGGSLGARTINQCIESGLKALVDANIQVIWQTGKNFQSSNSLLNGVKIFQFLKEMNFAYSCSDLVISRAGALSIAEIAVCGKASILIPSPNVTDDHQTQNALKLSDAGAAVLISDLDAPTLLIPTILNLLQTKGEIEKLEKHAQVLAQPMATQKIADELLKLCKQ